MTNQKIENIEALNLFEAEITIVNTNRLIRLIPHIELNDYPEEFIVKKNKNHLELIPFGYD